MLVESGALYDTHFALCVGPWASVDITVEFITAQILRTRFVSFFLSLDPPRSLDALV